ncbi:MAG: hypothetical protein AAB320_07490 [Elusimicrobiota bacterium]
MGMHVVLAGILFAAAAAGAQEAGVSAPFMAVELKMAPFKGVDGEETRSNAAAFLQKTGYKVLSYQDNEALRAADIALAPPPEGPLALIRYNFEKMRLLRALRARPRISEASEREGGRLQVLFSPFVYCEEADSLTEVLPPGAKVSYYRNHAMKGLWVNLDVSGIKDPQAAARELARRFPGQISSAEIKVKVEIMRVGTR